MTETRVRRAMAQAIHAARVVYADRPFVPAKRGDTRVVAVTVPIQFWEKLVEEVTSDERRAA